VFEDANQVDQYLDQQPPERRAALAQIRALVLESIPGAKETMRYRMPTYELDQVVCAFASQKHHMSLYLDVELVARYQQDWSTSAGFVV